MKIALVLGILAFIIIMYASSLNGIGVSPDSINYISAARELSNGNGFTTFSGAALVDQPPLYPLILALIDWSSGIDPLETARYFNALLFGITTALSTWIASRWFQSSFLFPLAGILILFSIPLFSVTIIARPEPLFILLTVSFLFSMKYYLDTNDPRLLVVCSILAGIAVLTRYIGISLIASGIFLILFFGENTLKNRIKRALFLGITSSFFLIIWFIRNWLNTDTFMGERAPSSTTLLDNLQYTAKTLSGWIFPAGTLDASVVIFGIVIAGFAYVYLRPRFRSNTDWSTARILIIFSVLYVAFLIFSSTTTAYDRINDRLLSPVFIPLIFLILFLLDFVLRHLPQKPQWGKTALLFIVGTLWIYPIFYTGSLVLLKAAHGAGGYVTEEWISSDTIQYLEQNRTYESCEVYSNLPEPLYLYLDINARFMPSKTYYNSNKQADSLDALWGKWPESNPSCLVWFKSGRSYLYSVEELAAIVDVIVIAELDDGTIYMISRKTKTSAAYAAWEEGEIAPPI